MSWLPFQKKEDSVLGIDIGSGSVKVVQLSTKGGKIKLENYGFSTANFYLKKPLFSFHQEKFIFPPENVASILKDILKEAKMKTEVANFALPDVSSFFTIIELPPMTKPEIPQAISFEARKYIPLSPEEIIVDWSIIEGEPLKDESDKKEGKMKIVLAALPKILVKNYQKIAELAGLQLKSLEPEAFAIKRAVLSKEDKETICLVDIGVQSTSLTLVEKNILKTSHTIDLSSYQLTNALMSVFNLTFPEAEALKKKYGLRSEAVAEIIVPLIDMLFIEIEKVVQGFIENGGGEPMVYILTGGTALLPGLKEHFEVNLKKEIRIANPFEKIIYLNQLEPVLKKIGPSFVSAVGSALHSFE